MALGAAAFGLGAAIAVGVVLLERAEAPDAAETKSAPPTTAAEASPSAAQDAGLAGGLRVRVHHGPKLESADDMLPAEGIALRDALREILGSRRAKPAQLESVRLLALRPNEEGLLADAILATLEPDPRWLTDLAVRAGEGDKLAIALLPEAAPDRYMALLSLSRAEHAAGGGSPTTAGEILRLLAKDPAKGEALLSRALRSAADPDLPGWLDVVAGFRKIPAVVGAALADLLAGSALRRAAVSDLLVRAPASAWEDFAPEIASAVRDALARSEPADVYPLLALIDRLTALDQSVGESLLLLRCRIYDVPVSSPVKANVERWLRDGYPDVLALSAVHAAVLSTALVGDSATSYVATTLRGGDVASQLFLCRRVSRAHRFPADRALGEALLALTLSDVSPLVEAALLGLEGPSGWDGALEEQLLSTLDRRLYDPSESVRWSAAHAATRVPGTAALVAGHLALYADRRHTERVGACLVSGALRRRALLEDPAIAPILVRIFADETLLTDATVRAALIDGEAALSPPPASLRETARSIFPDRTKPECPAWMQDVAVRRAALRVFMSVTDPEPEDVKAVLRAKQDSTVAALARGLVQRPEWRRAASALTIEEWRTIGEYQYWPVVARPPPRPPPPPGVSAAR